MNPSQKVTSAVLALTAKLLSGATVRWRGSEPDACQRIYFANHTSHLDALVLWSGLPRQLRTLTRPVAAADYWNAGPVRRYVAGCFNALLIDRHDISVRNSPLDIMLREIGETHSLIVFPEGSRSPTGELQAFKSGLYYMDNQAADFEFIPVYVDNLNRILPRGEVLPVPLLSCITIGAPLWLHQGESKDGFLERARQAILQLKEEQ